jgi:hypothetical protein
MNTLPGPREQAQIVGEERDRQQPGQAGINADTRPLVFALSNVQLRHRP